MIENIISIFNVITNNVIYAIAIVILTAIVGYYVISAIYILYSLISVNIWYPKNKLWIHEKKRSLSEPKIFSRFRNFWPKADNREKLTIATFRKELDYERTSKIEYTIDIKNKRIEGVFEVIRKPEIEIKQFHLPIEQQAVPASCEIEKMMTNYLFNFNYPFIRGKEKINMAISGAYNFDERFKEEKGKEFYKAIDDFKLDNVSWLSCGLALDNVMSFYYRLKSFRNFDILYYDNRVVCVYKRVTKVDSENKELTMNNFSFIFELNSQKTISSYFTDLVVNGEELLSKYDTTQRFYNDINKLIFLLTDTGIIVMPQDREERIFIYSDDLKEYLNNNHYLFYFFNTQELLS